MKRSARPFPVALSIAGSDSSAGAGIQADLKTFSALGVYGLTAVTCVVAETPGKVSRIEPVSAATVREQVELLLKNFPVLAAKAGLLCSAEIIRDVARIISQARRKRDLVLVVDPVMVATSGDALLARGAIADYERKLFPLATLITPNMDEGSQLLGEKISTHQQMERAVRALSAKYKTAVLLKGGHLSGNRASDLLCLNERITEFSAPFVRGVATHGTGCTYSAAITAGLARGLKLERAIAEAKGFVSAAIRHHFTWGSGRAKLQALRHGLS